MIIKNGLKTTFSHDVYPDSMEPWNAVLSKQYGFSLVELIATLSIAAILLTTAVPGFFSMIQRDRLTTQANDFVSTLSLARAEAASRGQRIVVCKSASPYNACTGAGGWEQGWIVFTDMNGDDLYTAAADGANGILKVHEALGGNTTLSGDANIGNSIAFLGTGFSTVPQLRSLSLCDSSADANKGKNIVLLAIGQARVDANAPASCTP